MANTFSVKVNFPNLMKGEPVAIDGVGMVPNGSTQKVEEWQTLSWASVNGRDWPTDGTLVLPALTGDVNKTDAQSTAELEAGIIARQEARTPEQAKAEEAAAVAAAIRGEVAEPKMVDGKILSSAPDAPVVETPEPKGK